MVAKVIVTSTLLILTTVTGDLKEKEFFITRQTFLDAPLFPAISLTH